MKDYRGEGSVCGVIVTWNPGPDLIHNVRVLRQQADACVIVDNASSGASQSILEELERQIPCTVIRNPENVGIAAALNAGFRVAIENGHEWLVSFDQDSTITEEFIEALRDAARGSANTGLVCPIYLDRATRRVIPMPKTHSGDLLTTMTSGCLCHRAIFQAVGPFEEQLFIDSVDTEYSLRVRSMGLRLIQSERAVLLHSLGKLQVHRFLGRNLHTTNHSAARRYYITRNRLYVLRRYPRDLAWLCHDVRSLLEELLMVVLFERQRWPKLRMMARGAMDCMLGKWGRQIQL